MLLDAGADIEMELPNKDRPLHVALINEQEDIVQLLLKRGANVTARASNNRTPLHLAAEYSLPRATLTLLKSHHVSTEDIDEETWTPLCCCNTSEVARILIDHGADVNYADKDDWTPLHQAVHKRDTALVKLLLSAGADFKIRTTDDGLTIEERMQHVDDVRGHPIFERILKQVAALRQESVRDLEDDDIEIVNRVEEIV
jgi:ankyrin repeat protein